MDPHLVVVPAFLSPTRAVRLDPHFECAPPISADDTLEVCFDRGQRQRLALPRCERDTILAGRHRRNIARSLDAHDNAIRKRGVRAKMSSGWRKLGMPKAAW
jgi:hypothetical protein